VQFKTQILQGSAATDLRCGGSLLSLNHRMQQRKN